MERWRYCVGTTVSVYTLADLSVKHPNNASVQFGYKATTSFFASHLSNSRQSSLFVYSGNLLWEVIKHYNQSAIDHFKA